MLLKDVGFLTKKKVFHIFIICQKNTFKRKMKIHHNYFASYVMNLVILSIIVTIRSVRIFFYRLVIPGICVDGRDPVAKRGRVWAAIYWFNPAIFVCMSQTRTFISNVICRGLGYVHLVKVRGDCSFSEGER